MIEARDGEHAHHVQRDCDDDGRGTPTDPDDREANGVHQNKRNDARPVDLLFKYLIVLNLKAGVEPARERATDFANEGGISLYGGVHLNCSGVYRATAADRTTTWSCWSIPSN